ncbi:MAG: aminotransferase class III-fold pyridoxal phosphate-dependent enzyme [Paraglaciecola sp.]|uniref:aminotransferase class III-fold pyridoxal phosphate-dependent enzyme n=2 Tax=Paraglaciecola sp. TaxID=1920173 RepID=UPI003265BAF9
MQQTNLYFFIVAFIGIYLVYKVIIRLQLSKAKHPSLRGHSKWSRRIAANIPYFTYQDSVYFCSDGATKDIADTRRAGLQQLQQNIRAKCSKTIAHYEPLEESVSDVRFTSHYRIPFPYRRQLTKEFTLGSIACETKGSQVKDLDGNWRYDLSGSYGVNVFGYDFYKACMDVGSEKAKAIGPVLGAYHPLITENVELIKKVSGLDEVSFHMSGTEAVMQAVRLARYHTGRTHLVRLCGAYHGWWDGVQPGIGNNRKTHDVYTLSDLSEQTLHILNTRRDIACVLINPLQAFHPNADSASDVSLVASDRQTHFDKNAYTRWLEKIREVCTKRNIVLIFDEVFTGFRLSHRGAQGFFGIQADMVTYGKTLGGGFPVGAVAGTHRLMKRFKDNKPIDVSFARGTFNSHPYVIAAMNEFLTRVQQPQIQEIYATAEQVWNNRVAQFNQALLNAKLPIQITNMHSILSVMYTQPSRYNWMLQFYLRDAGLELSWTGTGRFIMNLSYTDQEFQQVIKRFVAGATQMQADGWWWSSAALTNNAIKKQFLNDILRAKFPAMGRFLASPLIDQNLNTSEPSGAFNEMSSAPSISSNSDKVG